MYEDVSMEDISASMWKGISSDNGLISPADDGGLLPCALSVLEINVII